MQGAKSVKFLIAHLGEEEAKALIDFAGSEDMIRYFEDMAYSGESIEPEDAVQLEQSVETPEESETTQLEQESNESDLPEGVPECFGQYNEDDCPDECETIEECKEESLIAAPEMNADEKRDVAKEAFTL